MYVVLNTPRLLSLTRILTQVDDDVHSVSREAELNSYGKTGKWYKVDSLAMGRNVAKYMRQAVKEMGRDHIKGLRQSTSVGDYFSKTKKRQEVP
ncbi:hypothetical protein N7478_011396 [Penicillium angulare]|uniref:uncharacterized protein n=1 Tax=Penicillium angulare TaxID=116970 RepID=UPI002541A1BC|nr:uncharacterized protein N7478_011396 [Penicillium angulare]KAJ5263791.1 hypothetical protein N7478_011396 [Penicillium angulare]